jgi:WD40 repeat protein
LDAATGLTVSPDGNTVYVTGSSYATETGDDFATVSYDANNGEQLWAIRYDDSGFGDFAYSIAASPDGARVFVTGGSADLAGTSHYATVAYDASAGSQLWVSRYNGPADLGDVARVVRVSPDGVSIFVTGYSYAANGYPDFATAAYDASTGAQRWVRRYDGPINGDDEAWSLGVSPDGTAVFVTGQSYGSSGTWDYLTIAYRASTGARGWLRRYNGPGNSYDQPLALGLNPDGSAVYVTGLSVGSGTGEDYTTIAYRASTGAGAWIRRYDSLANEDDEANALAVSADGSEVVVTGTSHSPGRSWDYVTIAYMAR